MANLNRIQRTVAAAAIGLVVLAGARLWFVEGLLRRVMIDGPSMAPALCGAHHVVICGDCGFPFRCDAEHVPADGRAACPNCGFTEIDLGTARRAPPERAIIDRWPLLWRSPQRGEVVAVQLPKGELAVKRIAALPGERMVIRGGDLYADKRPIRKSRSELRAVRLLVHDNAYQPRKTAGLPPRWQPTGISSGWKASGAGFRIEPSKPYDNSVDWLAYVHWPCTADTRLRGAQSPVMDNDSYNQGELRRTLSSVSDVMLSCRVRASGESHIMFAAVDGLLRFEAVIESGKQVVLLSRDETVFKRTLATDFTQRPTDVEFGLVDQQVLLVVNGQTLVRFEYEREDDDRALSEEPTPLAIGSRGLGLSVEDLRVWRDIYFLDPNSLPRRWEATSPLSAGHFALLGDNQPVSIDSRHWHPPGIALSAIRGCVYRPFWARQ
jgi:Signal peptidase, peptidase S26